MSTTESTTEPTPDEGLRHTRSIEVSWGDCDAAGVVFYPHYYAWFDASTHAMLDAAGLDHHRLRRDFGALGTPLVRAEADFRSSATFGDTLTAECRIARLGRRSFTVAHRLSLGDRVVAEGQEVRVWAEPGPAGGPPMRVVPMPEAVRAALGGVGPDQSSSRGSTL